MTQAQRWLLKTEPADYSFADLERDGSTVWDGVRNNTALKYIRTMHPGDQVLIYHTGDERQIAGLAEVTSEPYPDPEAGDEKLVVVDLRSLRRLPRPVSLATIKADARFSDFALVRQGRLSVVPVTEEQWSWLLALAGLT